MSYIGNSPGVASQRVVTTFTATAGQTTFTPTSGYTLGYCDVFMNGIKLISGDDYSAADGVSVVLAAAAAAGDSVEVVAHFPRGLSDGYTKSEADSKYVALTGDQSVAGVKTFSDNVAMTARVGVGAAPLDCALIVSDGTQDLQARIGKLSAGVDPFVRFQGQNAAGTTNRYADIQLDSENALLKVWAPKTTAPTILAASVDSSGHVIVPAGISIDNTYNAATTLGDYEEGTFTPTVYGSTSAGTTTYTTQLGVYTKIGNVVYFKLALVWTAATGTGAMRLGGLPFTVNASQPYTGFNAFSKDILYSGTNLFALVHASSTYIDIYTTASNVTATTVAVDAAGTIEVSGFYFA